MNRELIVRLLKKNIDDLILLTEGFEQMTSYPDALIQLAQLKTNDIKQYLYELGDLKHSLAFDETVANPVNTPEISFNEDEPEPETIQAGEFEQVETEVSIPEIPYEEEKEEQENKFVQVEAEITPLAESSPEVEEVPELFAEVPQPEVAPEPDSKDSEPATEVPEHSTTPEPLVIAEPGAEVPEIRKTTLGETINNGITRNDIHSTRESDLLNNAMANKKIDDIRQAISIGDRFRFQRELFRNNGEEMNKMLNYINLLASFKEIEAFLQKKYGWETDNEVAKDFYAIVSRKFI